METSSKTESYQLLTCSDEEGTQWSQRSSSIFTWTLSPSSLLNLGSGIVRTESAPYFIGDKDTAILFLTPRHPETHLGMKLSNATSISEMEIFIQINDDEPQMLELSGPIPRICSLHTKIHYFEDLEPGENPFLNKLSINVRMEVTRSSEFCLSQMPSINWPDIKDYFYFWGTFGDFTFLLGDKKIYAHKNILAGNSEVFEEMFIAPGGRISSLKIVDTDVRVFGEFLQFLYGHRVNKLTEIVDEMMAVADTYRVDDLKLLCEHEMMAILCPENVLKYNSVADRFGCVRLKRKALEMIENNPELVCPTA